MALHSAATVHDVVYAKLRNWSDTVNLVFAADSYGSQSLNGVRVTVISESPLAYLVEDDS